MRLYENPKTLCVSTPLRETSGLTPYKWETIRLWKFMLVHVWTLGVEWF